MKKGVVTGMAADDVKVPYVACEDIGEFARLAFEDPDTFLGRKLNLIGDFISGDDLAELLRRLSAGRPIRHKAPPMWLMWIFAREWISLRKQFESWGRPPYPEAMVDSAVLERPACDIRNWTLPEDIRMSVVVRNSGATVTAPPVNFENEHELETILGEQVTLLRTPSDGPLAFVARQVRLADAGTLDLLCVDADGLPVAIEVKLARNATRRAVVAQIVDYLSALTAMTVDELDQEVDGDLEAALNTFNTEDDPGGFERRWKALGANLRAGLARIIVAMDESPSDLGRIVRFLSEHSNLDIRLVTISKYVDAGVGTVYVPNVVVSTEGKAGTPPQKRPTVDPETFMEAWAVSAGPAAALAWGTFCQALESAGIEGLHAGNYPGGSPYYSVDSPVGRIRLVRLADPRVSAAELRDMLHVGALWDEYPQAAMAREVFRATLLHLVPGAQRAGGANRVYLPVAALQHVIDDVVAAVSTLTSQIASALRDDGDRPVGPTGDGASSLL